MLFGYDVLGCFGAVLVVMLVVLFLLRLLFDFGCFLCILNVGCLFALGCGCLDVVVVCDYNLVLICNSVVV